MLKQLRIIGALLLISMICCTWLFWIHEYGVNPNIKSYGDALWWWFVSSTTVGYGDISPITGMGRLAGVVTIIIGIYCYTNFISITADSLHGLTNQKHLGTAIVTATNHVVICEYTAFADELIQVLGRYPELNQREIVILTDLVQTRPYPQFHFVRGVPLSPFALRQANIVAASHIFVFANARFVEPDLKTLHIVSRIRKLVPKACIYVELNNPEHELVSHLGENTIILSSKDMLASVLRDGSIDLSAYFAAGAKS
jgi:voltage-gated potassium channel